MNVDPSKLAARNLPLQAVIDAVRKGNAEVGGRLVELSGREYMVRGRGYIRDTADLEKLVLLAPNGTPVRVGDVATVTLGPEMRRGIADLDGHGDVVGGIVVMRQGENALHVIDRVKAKLGDLKRSLPDGVDVVTTYDRSDLIGRAVGTNKHKLVEEIVIVSLVILLFLWHIPSATVPILTIPASVALAFIPLYAAGIGANLMSLAGIAISIGVLVDGAIVEVENAYNKIHLWQAGGRKGNFRTVRLEALLEVGPAVFFSLLVIAVAFIPVFTSWAPEWLKTALRTIWRDRISEEELVNEMDQRLRLPGISNAWTMPIKGRLDMLSTGIRTPVGIKVSGANLDAIQKVALDIEAALQSLPGTRSVSAERTTGGHFLDFAIDRDRLARYGLSVDDANAMVTTAVGGDQQTTIIEGRARYGAIVRYSRDFRDDLDSLRRVLVPLPGGRGQIPMAEIADVHLSDGPSMIRDENGLLARLLFLDLAHDEARTQGRLRTRDDLVEAIIHGAVKRVRPKAVTVCAAGMGLLPIMWATGTGSDLMKRIAAPMVGGLSTSFAMELLVYPAIYYLWRRREAMAKAAMQT